MPDLRPVAARTFSITVPRSWYELDLDPATRDRSVREQAERRLRFSDGMWPQRHAVVRLLTEQARSAYDAGAAYCAAFVIPTDDGPVTGAVTVSLLRGPALSGAAATVEIPGVGTCVRAYGIDDVPLDHGSEPARSVFMETALPVPGSDQVFLVSATSPMVPLAEELHEVFDAVTGTFRLEP